MTVALLAKWGDQPPGTLYTSDSTTEAAMVTAKVATANLAGAIAWVKPGSSPGSQGEPFTRTESDALRGVVSGDGLGVPEYAAQWESAIAAAMRLKAPTSLPTIPETLPAVVSGTTYYIDPLDPAASDSNAGTSVSLPWASIAKINGLNPGAGAVILIAADAVFEFAQTWTAYKAYGTTGLIVFDNLRGTITQPITIKPYYPRAVSDATKPTIRWFANTVGGDWTQEAGNGGRIWSTVWSRTTAITREMQVFFGPNRAVLGLAPGQDSNLPTALSMANQFVADGSKVYVWVPDATNPVTYYGAVTITGGNAVFQTFWNGGHYLRIFGLRFEDCYPLKLSYASSAATDVKGFELAYCQFYRTISVFLRNGQTEATAREFETSVHDCEFLSLPHTGIRHSSIAGTAGNTHSWEVYRNRVIGANLSASYGGGLLYNQAIGGTKHHAWGNYGYDCRNGAGTGGLTYGTGAAQIDGSFIYFDIGVDTAVAWANIAERCGMGYQGNRMIRCHYVGNLAIDCGSFGSFTASAGSESNKAITLAHNTWLWTGRINRSQLERGPNIGGDTIGNWDTWPVFEVSNQQAGANSQASATALQRLVFVNNLAINASGSQFTGKAMFGFPETRIASGALLVAGNAAAGLANNVIVDKDSGTDRSFYPRYMALRAASSVGAAWVASATSGVARPAIGSPLIGAGEPLNVTYRDIGGRAFALAPLQPTIGCYEVNA
jgi:hypothetical protein